MSSESPPVPRRRRARVGRSLALLVLVLALTGAGYAGYRVNRFKRQVFRASQTLPQTEYEQPVPAATTVPTAAAEVVVATTSTPTTAPRGTVAPSAATIEQASPTRRAA